MHNIETPRSRVYILTDAAGRITRVEGEYTLGSIADLSAWTLLEEGPPCDRLNLAQSHYFDGGLYTEDGVLRWKYEDGACALRSEDELSADRAATAAQTAPTEAEDLSALLVEHEYRLTLLELGLTD